MVTARSHSQEMHERAIHFTNELRISLFESSCWWLLCSSCLLTHHILPPQETGKVIESSVQNKNGLPSYESLPRWRAQGCRFTISESSELPPLRVTCRPSEALHITRMSRSWGKSWSLGVAFDTSSSADIFMSWTLNACPPHRYKTMTRIFPSILAAISQQQGISVRHPTAIIWNRQWSWFKTVENTCMWCFDLILVLVSLASSNMEDREDPHVSGNQSWPFRVWNSSTT